MERHKTTIITCNGTTMGRFPRLTPVRPDSRSPGAGTHDCHIAGTRVSIGRRGKEWGTGPSMFMGVLITDEISWMTDSPAQSFVG